MCASFIICKVGTTITGIENKDGTYTVTTKEIKPRRFIDVQILKESEVASKYGQYLSLDSFEKENAESDPKPMFGDTFAKTVAIA